MVTAKQIEFERLLRENKTAVERFVRFKIPADSGAEDVLQEVYLAAYLGFERLENRENFKPWILGIARNKCRDRYREMAKELELVDIESVPEEKLSIGIHGITVQNDVSEALGELSDRDSEILRLYYLKQLPQENIAKVLGIPIGTVKSRLHYAKSRLREKFPERLNTKKEEGIMNNKLNTMPEFIPDYKIEKSPLQPFPVKWEEMMGWFLVPRLGEKLSWAMYDFPERKKTEEVVMEVTGKATVHGIEGVEIHATELDPMEANATSDNPVHRTFVAQLTDTHSRILAESHFEEGTRKLYTFLDGDDFLDNWGFGEDNCGNEVNLTPKGIIQRDGDNITCTGSKNVLDVVGRYIVTIGGKVYETVCVMDIEDYQDGVVAEQYLDQNGKTILWRRFNADTWAIGKYQKPWSELLPENETITVNGTKFVHWYDCMTSYIL
ncbi:MAG: RNA polymerase sigma factor [Oscillospiraceae bacterium]|nr:RNA polymerase sigma factor [Oscillospiraceae bacterium]